MHNFDYISPYSTLLDKEIVSYVCQIYEYKGMLQQTIDLEPKLIAALQDIAKIQSTEASNKIEGIVSTQDRIKKLVVNQETPKTRDEAEIFGYSQILSNIHDNYKYISLSPNVVLQLHRDLYKHTSVRTAGQYKQSNNVIAEFDNEGNKYVRFTPVETFLTPNAVASMFNAYNKVNQDVQYDQLLIIPMFILDFLCIHPFNDGNGRMSRLINLLLLYQNYFTVGRYISLDQLIHKYKTEYYQSLQDSSEGWHDNKNTYLPFVKFSLSILLSAYEELYSRAITIGKNSYSKMDRIEKLLSTSIGKITKAQISEKLPDISQTTIQRALANLCKQGKLTKVTSGKYASYKWTGK